MLFLQLPTIPHKSGLEITPDMFDEIYRRIPYILNMRPSGLYPVNTSGMLEVRRLLWSQ